MGICCTRVISSSRLVITEIPFSILFITATGVVVVVGVFDSLSPIIPMRIGIYLQEQCTYHPHHHVYIYHVQHYIHSYLVCSCFLVFTSFFFFFFFSFFFVYLPFGIT